MATDYGICNSALLKIGAAPITSLTQGSVEANLCNEQYPKIRDAVLIAHPWKFAIKRVTLAQPSVTHIPIASAPGNYFDLPTDCLRLLQAGCPGDCWNKEGPVLVYNSTTVDIVYVAQITDPTQFSPSFCEALALRLAVDLTYSLVQSVSLRDQLMQEYRYELAQARSFSAQEGSSPRVYADDWLNSRY